jgi:hypothetical protein
VFCVQHQARTLRVVKYPGFKKHFVSTRLIVFVIIPELRSGLPICHPCGIYI